MPIIQPRIPVQLVFFIAMAHCWQLPTRVPRGLFQQTCLPDRQSPSCIIAEGSSFLSAGLLTCSCWISEGSCQPISPAYVPLPSSVTCILYENALHHLLQVIDADVKQDTSQDRPQGKGHKSSTIGSCEDLFPLSFCTGISYSICALPME